MGTVIVMPAARRPVTPINDVVDLAAVEFAAEVSGRALTVDMEQDDRPLPPGILSVGQLAGRMRSQARDVLSYRVSWPDLDTIGPCLAKAVSDDPLARGRVANPTVLP